MIAGICALVKGCVEGGSWMCWLAFEVVIFLAGRFAARASSSSSSSSDSRSSFVLPICLPACRCSLAWRGCVWTRWPWLFSPSITVSIIASRIQQAHCQIVGLQRWFSDAYGKWLVVLSTDWLVGLAPAFVDTQGVGYGTSIALTRWMACAWL